MKHWSVEDWIKLAQSNLVYRDAATLELAQKIGRECYAREQRGENSSIVHVSASLAKKRCWCFECHP